MGKWIVLMSILLAAAQRPAAACDSMGRCFHGEQSAWGGGQDWGRGGESITITLPSAANPAPPRPNLTAEAPFGSVDMTDVDAFNAKRQAQIDLNTRLLNKVFEDRVQEAGSLLLDGAGANAAWACGASGPADCPRTGKTALMEAAYNDDAEMVELLLYPAAKLRAPGDKPIAAAIALAEDPNGNTALNYTSNAKALSVLADKMKEEAAIGPNGRLADPEAARSRLEILVNRKDFRVRSSPLSPLAALAKSCGGSDAKTVLDAASRLIDLGAAVNDEPGNGTPFSRSFAFARDASRRSAACSQLAHRLKDLGALAP